LSARRFGMQETRAQIFLSKQQSTGSRTFVGTHQSNSSLKKACTTCF
jgi:hypothetical protein